MEKACETFNVSKIPELMLVIYIYQNAKLRRSPYSVAFFVVLSKEYFHSHETLALRTPRN